ncbi:glycosyltransferase WbuB [Ktedonosporobacter rubrisoli]|uniref:Glycosyltransferase WbuB n=1 Tax=Ktedonosporobacter rubrisoli TaxID=2509675 RepID=A0A4P6JU00_KTERU|nr:glycosyltransferase family 4 protein [Ktedonosporobacter rubrisoli]QBD78396.1 glycosyltransferase WbuB [Ktedonosporobacter rubrisoli]
MAAAHSILMLVENLSVPADPRVWREAQFLRQCGYQVSIICPKGERRDRESYICIDGIHIYRYRLPVTIRKASDYIKEYGLAMLNSFGLSLKVWRRQGFDIIHAANPPDTFFLIGLFYRLFGKKFIFDQHDLAPAMFHIKFKNRMRALYKLHQFLERCSYRTANVVITTNESQKRNAIEQGKCRQEKVFVVRNGPDIARYTLRPGEPELKQGKRYLLIYIGVMGSQDGVEYALHALADLVHRRGRHDVALTLLGDGDQLPILKTLAHELKLDEYIHFAGWVSVPEMLRYLAAADIGLSPDPSNELNDRSTMLKTMEYMAMGKPVVAFDLPETHFSAQEAALYATPNEVEEFANHIETLLNDEDLRHRLGVYGRKRIEDLLSWDCTKQNLRRAYEALTPAYSESGSANSDLSDPVSASAGH